MGVGEWGELKIADKINSVAWNPTEDWLLELYEIQKFVGILQLLAKEK